jgi:hypothetical protein
LGIRGDIRLFQLPKLAALFMRPDLPKLDRANIDVHSAPLNPKPIDPSEFNRFMVHLVVSGQPEKPKLAEGRHLFL